MLELILMKMFYWKIVYRQHYTRFDFNAQNKIIEFGVARQKPFLATLPYAIFVELYQPPTHKPNQMNYLSRFANEINEREQHKILNLIVGLMKTKRTQNCARINGIQKIDRVQ